MIYDKITKYNNEMVGMSQKLAIAMQIITFLNNFYEFF